uniref:outer membrane beta-barrel protein n=1 Tax=Fluviicola sp. TaxID=1917219 RepID=UPI002634638D
MKAIAIFFLFVFSWIYSTSCAQQKIPVFELHGSVNHPLGGTRTFYGGGFGANLVFMDERKLSFKTGFETNFFHTWNKSAYVGHMASSSNVHYKFWNLSIPLMFRLNVGKSVKFFLEAGGYLGIPLVGTSTSKYSTYGTSPQNPGTSKIRTEKFE